MNSQGLVQRLKSKAVRFRSVTATSRRKQAGFTGTIHISTKMENSGWNQTLPQLKAVLAFLPPGLTIMESISKKASLSRQSLSAFIAARTLKPCPLPLREMMFCPWKRLRSWGVICICSLKKETRPAGIRFITVHHSGFMVYPAGWPGNQEWWGMKDERIKKLENKIRNMPFVHTIYYNYGE